MTVIVPLQPQPNLGLPPPDIAHDPATPRAVLAHSVVAAVAAVTLPTLSPVLVSHEPDYCLALKRKPDDDDVPDGLRSPKRLKQDASDALFGPPINALATQEVAEFTLDPAYFTAAICSALPPSEESQPEPVSVPSAPALEPAQPPEQLPLVLVPQRTPSPLAMGPSVFFEPSAEDDASTSWKHPIDTLLEAVPGGQAAAAPVQLAPSHSSELINITPATPSPQPARPRPPPVYRITEPPLWKLACRSRVEHVKTAFGISTIRATIVQEAARRSPFHSDASRGGSSISRSPSATSDLRLQIYTPSTFLADPSSPDEAEPLSPKTESELEDDVDMSFDLDDDTDSDAEDNDSDDDSEDEPMPENNAPALEHESIMDVSFESVSKRGREDAMSCFPSPSDLAHTHMHNMPITIRLESDLPPLPILRSLPVWCLREYPEVRRYGTPSCAPPHARGILSRAALQAQERLLAEPQSHFDWS